MQIQLLSGTADNPAYMRTYRATDDTELKRAGILIGAKVDMYEISKNLRWAYLPQGQLIKLGLTVEEAKKLKTELRKAEELFEKTGGSRLQFARAILEGSGNNDGRVKIDYKTLGSVAASFEEQVLNASPSTLLSALKSQFGLGSLDNAGESVNKASDTLVKIGSIASSISSIANGLATQVNSSATAPTADVHTKPEKSGITAWVQDNKVVTAGGLLLLAGLAVTKFNVPDNEKRGLSGVKRKSSTKRKAPRRTTRKSSTKRRSARPATLGVVPLM